MRPLFRFPDVIGVDFIGKRAIALAFSAALTVASLVSLATQGLNLGIDFQGGILIEARAQQEIDLGPMREKLGGLGLGEVALSHVDSKRDIMIRIERQEGGEKAQAAAIDRIKEALGTGIEYRRTESVGPTVGRELLIGGVIATLLDVLAKAEEIAARIARHPPLAVRIEMEAYYRSIDQTKLDALAFTKHLYRMQRMAHGSGSEKVGKFLYKKNEDAAD